MAPPVATGPLPNAALPGNVPAELISTIVEGSRKAGNEAFKGKNYRKAIEASCVMGSRPRSARSRRGARRGNPIPLRKPQLYSQALAGAPGDPVLLCNRSAAFLKLGLVEEALADAVGAARADGSSAKAFYRCVLGTCGEAPPRARPPPGDGPGAGARPRPLFPPPGRRIGCARMAACDWAGAEDALRRGAGLAPGDPALASRLAEAAGLRAEAARCARAALRVPRKDLSMRLRRARAADQRHALLQQWKKASASDVLPPCPGVWGGAAGTPPSPFLFILGPLPPRS